MSTIGRILKVTTFGESHGIGVGCIIEGIPPNLLISTDDIQYQLNRRKPNQNSLLSPRNEPDIVEIYSGIQDKLTLGTPIALIVKNLDIKPSDYKSFSNIPRPGHADLTYLSKYGVKSASGGGRASARETVARVAAGAAVEKFLKTTYGCEIVSFVSSIGEIFVPKIFEAKLISKHNLAHKEFEFDKKFLDCIGTFYIFHLSKGIKQTENQLNNESIGNMNQEENQNIEGVEKWILINKLTNKAYLFLIYNDRESELVDLGFELILPSEGGESIFNPRMFLNISNDHSDKQIKEKEEGEEKEKEKVLDDKYIVHELDYYLELNKIIKLLDKELVDKEFSEGDQCYLKFEDFLGESLDKDLKLKLLDSFRNISKEKLKIKKNLTYNKEAFEYVEAINIRCPHITTSAKMIQLINKTKSEKDSIGGIASCIIRNIPRSLGEPCFDKFEAELAKAMLSIPATKGFEIGSGFEGTKLKGSQHNDLFIPHKAENLQNKVKSMSDPLSITKIELNTSSNNAGGTLGGITTGENVFFRVAIKPVSTIGKNQNTYDFDQKNQILQAKGRHDPCVLPRAMPIIEAMAAIITGDHCLMQAARKFTVDCMLNNMNNQNLDENDNMYEDDF